MHRIAFPAALLDPLGVVHDAPLYSSLLEQHEGVGAFRRLRTSRAPYLHLGGLGGLAPEKARDVARALEAIGKIQRRYNLWSGVRLRGVSPDASGARALGRAARAVHALLLAHSGAEVLPLPGLARAAGLSPASVQVALSRLAWAGLAEVSPAGGAVADILAKPGPLSAEEERMLSEALDFRGRADRAHLEAIGRYANLATCRREHLLSHFGDSAALGAAPCGGCDVCDPRPGLGARSWLGRRALGRTALAALAAVFGTARS